MKIEKIEFKYNSSVISEESFIEHKKLYANYILKFDEISRELNNNPELNNSNATYSKYRALKKEESFTLNAIILHEKYFENLGSIKTASSKRMSNIIFEDFDGYENWKDDFIACSKAARGWVTFGYNERIGKFINNMIDSHNGENFCETNLLVVNDLYEHNWFSDYGVDKSKYINNFVENIDWDIVEKRFRNMN